MSILAITGESASGKTSIVKQFTNNLGFGNIIFYTTRKPRANEIDGVDYYFVTEAQFIELKNKNFFIEISKYNGWYYGSAKKDYTYNSVSKIVILTPCGIRQIKKNEIDIYIVYIKVPRRDRLINILRRGDNIEEAYRRNLSEVGQFDGIENEVDLVIENDGYKKSIKDIFKEIFEHYYLDSK